MNINPSEHEEERGRIPSGTPAHALPGNLSRCYYEAKKSPPPIIPVPPGWKRLLLPERVVYFSPSGIRLKNLADVKDYLTTEGTCKCGLSCGIYPDKIFDFDCKKPSEIVTYDHGRHKTSSCQHNDDVSNISSIQSHLHCPKLSDEKKFKKKKKKKKQSSSNGTSMLEVFKAKEAEKQRINEIISEQKKEYEDQIKLQNNPVSELNSEPTLSPPKLILSENVENHSVGKKNILFQHTTNPQNTQRQSSPFVPPPGGVMPQINQGGTAASTLIHHGQGYHQIPSKTSSHTNLSPSSIPQPMQLLAQSQQTTTIQPVMQLVNTINGPVLMPTIPMQPLKQQQLSVQQPIYTTTTTATPSNKKKANKKSKKVITSSSPPQMMVSSQPPPQQQQPLVIGSAGPHHFQGNPGIISPQNIVINQSPSLVNPVILHNGVLMQAPPVQQQPSQPPTQQILYNQFPEGGPSSTTLVQYSQPAMTGGQASHIFTNPSHHQTTYIMTNTGQLVPSTTTNLVPQQHHMDVINNNSSSSGNSVPPGSVGGIPLNTSSSTPISSPTKRLPSPPLSPPKLTKEVSSEDMIEFETNDECEEIKRKHQKSLMIHSFQKRSKKSSSGLNKKNSSPMLKAPSFLQSNLVDSSGLRATPPHSSSNDSTFDALVASVKDHPSYKNNNKKPSSNRILFVDSDESEYEEELSKKKNHEKKKKKRKKRNADDMIIQRSNSIKHSDGEDDYSLDDSGNSGGNSSHNAEDFKVGDLVWGPFGAFPSWPGKLIRGADEDQKVLICWFGSKTITEEDPTVLKTLSEGFDAHHKERKKMRKSRKLNASLEKAIQEAMMELDNEENMRCS